MSAAYDTFDYPAYWIGREYEHKSEIIALKSFISKIHKIKTILEIGAGFGRLVPAYAYRAKKIIITDPSSRLLKIARMSFKNRKNTKFIHSGIDNLATRVRPSSIDLIIMVRVIHHIEDIDSAIKDVERMLVHGGYFILEFANKKNVKTTISQFLKGNLTYPIDIFTSDIRSRKSIRRGTLPFLNYHPYTIEQKLLQNGFEIMDRRSVSNIRSGILKRIFSAHTLIYFERILQKPLSYLNFGPSIFLLARKIG